MIPKQRPVYYDNHMHTPLCKHAEGEPEEYAEIALQRGLKGIVMTCHSPMPDGWWPQVRMDVEQLDQYIAMVQRATETYAGRLDVRLGMEMDFFPGMEWWVEHLNERCDFHHVLGSVHFFGKDYKERFYKGNLLAFQKQYFSHVAESAETGLFDTLAHPDLVKNFQCGLWQFDQVEEHLAACLDRIAKTGVAMELNTSGINKAMPEFNPGPQMLRMMNERNIPVVLGSDSHTPRRVAADFDRALDSLEEAGYAKVSCFLGRKRQDFLIADVRGTLNLPHRHEMSEVD
ncbi:MAG TPA: histidinol-phosphatase [Verrucomicrobiales bacterium]|jgi:histidinol-phosphatase (PHP family)|nr:histidinol-phosphatase [Verrucomicrobiales bacterium]